MWLKSDARGTRREGTALGPIFAQTRDYWDQAKASSTRKSYERNWRHFVGWCQTHSRTALPAEPDTVALDLTDLAQKLKVATLAKRVAALSQAHQFAGYPSPTHDILVRTVLAGRTGRT